MEIILAQERWRADVFFSVVKTSGNRIKNVYANRDKMKESYAAKDIIPVKPIDNDLCIISRKF